MASTHPPAESHLPLDAAPSVPRPPALRFMLFAGDVALAQAAERAGVDRIVVDLERRDKETRQHGYHLECSNETIDDLRRMRAAVRIPILCRINPIHDGSRDEIEAVIAAGADTLMLPMFRTRQEVYRFVATVAGRATTSLLFETPEALELAETLDPRFFDEVYVGLNDLALALGADFPYDLLSTGILDRLRGRFLRKPFGFGGITVLDGGKPLPTRSILEAQARLRSTHVILRRAFKRDIQNRDMRHELQRLRNFYRSLESTNE